MKWKILCLLLICAFQILAQDSISTQTWKTKPYISFLVFTDLYYSSDISKNNSSVRSPYLYNHNRNNVLSNNLTLFQFTFKHPKYRANLGIQAGTYVTDNMSTEPTYYQPIHNTHVGFSLSKKDCLWIDAGVFNAHLGFENAHSTENLTLSRSLAAEQSPYYLTGVKLNYTTKKQLSLTLLLLNGWQHIALIPQQTIPAFGTNIHWKTAEKWNISWSTFIGSEFPDSERKMRYFNNLFAQYSSKKWNAIIGLDFGFQQQAKNSSSYNLWFVPTLIGQYCLNDKWRTALRLEYFQDKGNVILPSTIPSLFSTSWNWDYQPFDVLTFRIETRYFHGLIDSNNTNPNRLTVLGSVAFRFIKKWNDLN